MPIFFSKMKATTLGASRVVTLDGTTNLPPVNGVGSFTWKSDYGDLSIPASNQQLYDRILLTVNSTELAEGSVMHVLSEVDPVAHTFPPWRPLTVVSDLPVYVDPERSACAPRVSSLISICRLGGVLHVSTQPLVQQPSLSVSAACYAGYPRYADAACQWTDEGVRDPASGTFASNGDAGGGWYGNMWLAPNGVNGIMYSYDGAVWTNDLPTGTFAWDTLCVLFPVPAYGAHFLFSGPATTHPTIATSTNAYITGGSYIDTPQYSLLPNPPGPIQAIEKYPAGPTTYAIVNGSSPGLYSYDASGVWTRLSSDTSILNTTGSMAVSNSGKIQVTLKNGAGGDIYYSTNGGVTWATKVVVVGATLRDVVYNRFLGMFIAVGEYYTHSVSTPCVWRSVDGVNWYSAGITPQGYHALSGASLATLGHATVLYGTWGKMPDSATLGRERDTILVSPDGGRTWLPTGANVVGRGNGEISGTTKTHSGFLRGGSSLLFVGDGDTTTGSLKRRLLRSHTTAFGSNYYPW